MLENIRGISDKQKETLKNELGIATAEDLLTAIAENKIAPLKGFGEKTQENLKGLVHFYLAHKGKIYYATAEKLAEALQSALQKALPDAHISPSGDLRRKMPVIDHLLFVIGTEDKMGAIEALEKVDGLRRDPRLSGPFRWRGTFGESDFPVEFNFTTPDKFHGTLLTTTGSPAHINAPVNDTTMKQLALKPGYDSEEAIYQAAGLPYIAPEIREGQFEIEKGQNNALPKLIEMKDLRGILHNHSTYSDGKNTLEEMALYCKEQGYEYLGITDHSKSSFYYANGLYEPRVKAQQEEIDALNEKLAPFRIFKGIECDILPDGSLDYNNETLASFDFIIVSIHSAMKMDIEKATNRLLMAISNPFTTILGHMTGRLLLRREGYPVDHKTIIDACAKYGVAIEINANPKRLDIDWQWVHYALEQGVMLSINPDAHSIEGFLDMYYGLCVGRKGGLTKSQNLNSMSLEEITAYFKKKKDKA